VDQGHFGCISRRARSLLSLLQPFSIISLHVLGHFTFRAAFGVESSLYGPSAHSLFDIVRLKGVQLEGEEHNLEEWECTQTWRGRWCRPPMFRRVGGCDVTSDLWSDALMCWKLHVTVRCDLRNLLSRTRRGIFCHHHHPLMGIRTTEDCGREIMARTTRERRQRQMKKKKEERRRKKEPSECLLFAIDLPRKGMTRPLALPPARGLNCELSSIRTQPHSSNIRI
jgi:hypothetical protein